MAQLRLAMAQVNPTVGALAANAQMVRQRTKEAAEAGAHLVVFPEMVLVGYPVEDLALRRSFQRASRSAVHALAADLAADGLGDLPVVVGHLDFLDDAPESIGVPRGAPINAASVLHGGEVVATYAKHHLPNYGVFDEFRYFVPGDQPVTIRVAGIDITLAICEDMWQDGGPEMWAREAKAGLMVVINGSPYEVNKDDVRLALCRDRARESGTTLAYVNMVGGQDELVFDGDSMVVTPEGELLARAEQFDETLMVVDLDLPAADPSRVPTAVLSPDPVEAYEPVVSPVIENLQGHAEIYTALVVGLRDYVRKNGFKSVVLGLSGGIDSALVAALAVDAIGPDNVHCISMPSVYSSEHSKSDARELTERTGCHFRMVPIAPMVQAYQDALALTGLAEENLQARVRGTTLMGISNQEGHLVLAPGNKSELSVGYSTIYGDAVGGFAPIKDCPKLLVWALSRWRNEEAGRRGETAPITPNSISKPPSAELRPGQLDTDSLPDYEILDKLLEDYVEKDMGADELVNAGYERAMVERIARLTDLAEYKRRQYPPGTKITLRAFGRDRRQPITNRFREIPTA